MTLGIVWRSKRLSLIDVSDMNNIKRVTPNDLLLPGNPSCLQIVNTPKGWTAYCGQSNGYISIINISTTDMVKVIDVKLPNVNSNISLDLSIDNSLIYAIGNQDCNNSTIFVLNAEDLSLAGPVRNLPGVCTKILYQLGTINALYTAIIDNPTTLEIGVWDVNGRPPRQLNNKTFAIPFANDSDNTAKSFNGSQDSLIYICNYSSNIITGIRATQANPFNQLPNMTLPDKMTAMAPVSYDGKAYVSAGSNLCIVDKDKGVTKTIPIENSANTIDVARDSSTAYLLLNNEISDYILKVDFKKNNTITKGVLPGLLNLGFTLIPPSTSGLKTFSGCSCEKKK
ncbi:MAG: hypothetical protein JSR76_02090 [Verrucomicrobia bacterium]|nr:hypothetical protein [Verrucomicrobiota bacterium]